MLVYLPNTLGDVYGHKVDDTVVTMLIGATGASIAGKLAASFLTFLKSRL